MLYDALEPYSASSHTEENEGLMAMLAFIRSGRMVSGRHGAGTVGGMSNDSGKLHIGLGNTDQTTGGGFHLCGHFLTTMERTSLDFNGAEGYWNRELLVRSR